MAGEGLNMNIRNILIAGAACTALALGGCATSPQMATTEGQAIAASWSALDAAAVTIDGLAKSGVLHGVMAAEAAKDLNTAVQALQAATDAYNHGDNTTAASSVASATALIAALISITQNPGG